MTEQQNYCGHCGAPLDINDQFCGGCGNQVAIEPGPAVRPAHAYEPPPPPLDNSHIDLSTGAPTSRPAVEPPTSPPPVGARASRPPAKPARNLSRTIIGAVVFIAIIVGIVWGVMYLQDMVFISTDTMYFRGENLFYGEYSPIDQPKAAYWFERAAVKGNLQAMDMLGLMYTSGIGVAEDQKAGFAWYKKAADAGLAEAKLHLGDSYQFGRGVNSDMDTALELYTEAAKLGNTDAMYILGMHYLENAGLDFNLYMKGVDWLTKAAKAGNEGAQLELTEMNIDWNK